MQTTSEARIRPTAWGQGMGTGVAKIGRMSGLRRPSWAGHPEVILPAQYPEAGRVESGLL